jgi:hypothetical protein
MVFQTYDTDTGSFWMTEAEQERKKYDIVKMGEWTTRS